MAELKFPFEKRSSHIFGTVWRPIARVSFWSEKIDGWVDVIMIIDTGADYTLLPRFYAAELGINIRLDCIPYPTAGIGGTKTVYLLKKIKAKLGSWQGEIPVGFLDQDNVPPLLGRQDFLEKLKVTFHKHYTCFVL